MAYGLKYSGTFSSTAYNDLASKDYIVKLLFDGYVGSSSTILLNGFSEKDKSYGDSLIGIKEVKFTFGVVSDALGIDDFYPDSERHVKVELYSVVGETETLVRSGFLMEENASEEYADGNKTIIISATDGLELLKGNKYFDDNEKEYNVYPYSERVSILTIIRRCIERIGTDLNFNTAFNMNDGVTAPSISFDVLAYRERGQKDLIGKSCYEVLSMMAESLNCQVFQDAGEWWFVHLLGQRDSGQFYRKWSSVTGDYISGGTIGNSISIGYTEDVQKLGGGIISLNRPYKRVISEVGLEEYSNRLLNSTFVPDGATYPNWNLNSLSLSNGGSGTKIDPYYLQINDAQPGLLFDRVEYNGVYQDVVIGDLAAGDDNLSIVRKQIRIKGKVISGGCKTALVGVYLNIPTSETLLVYYLSQDGNWNLVTDSPTDALKTAIVSGFSVKRAECIEVNLIDKDGLNFTKYSEFEILSETVKEASDSKMPWYSYGIGGSGFSGVKGLEVTDISSATIAVVLYKGLEETDVVLATPYVRFANIDLQVIDSLISQRSESLKYVQETSSTSSRELKIDRHLIDFDDKSQALAITANDVPTTTWVTNDDNTPRELVEHLNKEILYVTNLPQKVFDGDLKGFPDRFRLGLFDGYTTAFVPVSWNFDFRESIANGVRYQKLWDAVATYTSKKYGITTDGREVLFGDNGLPTIITNNDDPPRKGSPVQSTKTGVFGGNLVIDKAISLGALSWIDSAGLVTDYLRPSGSEFFLKADSGEEELVATSANAWMIGATNALTAKDYIGSVSGDFDIGIKRAGTEILTIKSTGVDIAGTFKISGLTASELTATDANKNLQSLALATYPSLAEVSYVKGVTNSIQDQIDLKFNIASFTDVAVTSKLLTGLSISGASVEATDSILVAVGKLQAQVTAQLGGLIFQSTWNADTNTPTITASTGTKGHYYIVSTAGSTSIDGESDWKAKDWVVFNGTTWDKVDNTDSVSSVNGEVGAVSLTTDDITEGVTNLYYTDAAVRSAISESIIGIDYNNSTGIFSTSSGYGIPTTIKQGEWDTAYTLASSSWLLNGNTLGAKKTIGSLDAYDVGIIRGGTEIVTIKSTGVNILGVTSSETINAGDTSVNIHSWIYNSDWSLKIEQKNVAGSHIQYNFNQNNNGVETTVMGIKQGKIGFGTEDPTAQHTIYGAGQATNTGVDTTGALGGAILIQDSTVGAYNGGVALFGSGTNSFAGIKGELRDGSNYTLGDLSFQTRNASTDSTLTTRLFIGKDGKVGVGTILPTELFDVNGTGRFTNAKITASAALGYIAVSDASGSIIWTDPSALNSWQGNYNASTDTPSLSDGTGTYGNWYHVEVAGTNDFGSGNITFALGDRVIYDGSQWIKQTQNYTLNDASASVLGGIKIGSTLEIASGVANQKSGIATAGTYKSVTVDTYGRVTAGTNPTTIAGYGITDYDSLWDTRLAAIVVPIANGGTGSATQNFVDLSTNQTISGVKDFNSDITVKLITIGKGGGSISSNSALGNSALLSNTTGGSNSAFGSSALATNVTGSANSAFGSSALTANSAGRYNSGFGAASLYRNGLGNSNTGIGYASLYGTLDGSYNSAVGDRSLFYNDSGEGNTAMGYYAGYNVLTGSNNTVLGYFAGGGITTGSGNTIIGANITGLSATLADTLIIGAGGRQDLIADATSFRYNGLLKPSGTAGTAGQFLGTDGTNDEWQTLTVANILETLTITNGSFSRDLYGLHLAPTDTQAFFVGFDAASGLGVFRNKIWSDTEEVTFVEHGFDIYESGRFGIVTDEGNFRHYAFTDELGSSGGTVGTLQTVTDNGAISTNRLQYLSGGETVNYALYSDIIEAQGIEATLATGNVVKNNFLTFQAKTLSYLDTGLKFKDISGDDIGSLTFAENASDVAIGLTSYGKLSLSAVNDSLTVAGENIFLSTTGNIGGVYVSGDLEMAVSGRGVIMKDTVNPTNRYRLTIASGNLVIALI